MLAVAPPLLDLPEEHAAEPLLHAIDNDDVLSALGGEPQRRRAADAAPSARDQYGLPSVARQAIHAQLP